MVELATGSKPKEDARGERLTRSVKMVAGARNQR
jgi:hypothetical protein